ncbi:hypothetical protein BP5796_01174 [Coleophoma crateriformis]|uniref:Uncharacterized protein n=1 Tax=Coleophoma crateriformis TaxID=565419 RepID=A0A3D8SZS4_9HELO|nr:hypothetical protein BP5796_01174 [Coleophoma crateriformis]
MTTEEACHKVSKPDGSEFANAYIYPESVFAPMQEEFLAHLHRTPNAITPDQYATGVVREILKRSPAVWFWFGASSGTIRMIDALLPRSCWDWLFGRYFNLNKLTESPAQVGSSDSSIK